MILRGRTPPTKRRGSTHGPLARSAIIHHTAALFVLPSSFSQAVRTLIGEPFIPVLTWQVDSLQATEITTRFPHQSNRGYDANWFRNALTGLRIFPVHLVKGWPQGPNSTRHGSIACATRSRPCSRASSIGTASKRSMTGDRASSSRHTPSPHSSFTGYKSGPWAGPDLKEQLGGLNRKSSRSLLSETRFLDRHREAPIGQTIECLVEERVIRRDLWVALRMPCHQGDHAFLIETDDDELRFSKKDGPVFINPYLGPAVTFIATASLSPVVGHTNRGRF